MTYLLSHLKQQQDVARSSSVGKLRHRQERESSDNTAKPPAIIKDLQKRSTSPEHGTCLAGVTVVSSFLSSKE